MIIHLDADAFYVSVEQAENPALRHKPVAVGGPKRGIIASASYEARRSGVYTPMPTAQALRVCPGLVVVRGNMGNYQRYSRRMFALVEAYTPLIERTSIDEGYFDVSGHRTLSPLQIGEQLKARVQAELGIPISLGIGASKLVAQIAAKLRKPDALVEVAAGTEREFLAPLECHWLPGVGPKLAARLREAGLARIAQLAEAAVETLTPLAGSYAPQLQAYARGIDARLVETGRDEAKSYGVQDTFGENVGDSETLLRSLRVMADGLMARVRADHKAIRTVTVKVRYPNFAEASHATTLAEPTDLETDLYPVLPLLLRGAWKRAEPLRLIALRVSNVAEALQQGELALDDGARRRVRQRQAAQLLDLLRVQALPVTRGNQLG